MDSLSLYFRYAFRSFLRGRSRSLFGAFCVAVGVASVVALGLVGGNFQDAVTGNAQKLNRGDVSVALPGGKISIRDYRYFAQLKSRGAITDYTPLVQADAQIKAPQGDPGNVIIGSTVAVQSRKFPFYDTITADQPAGASLASLLRVRDGAVVSHTVFDKLNLQIGSRLNVAFRFGGTHIFTVIGVVPDNAPDPGFGGGLFPYFAMVDVSALASYMKGYDIAASTVYLKTRDAAQAVTVKADIERHFGGLVNPKTVADVQKDSVNGADGLNKFFRIMSLIAVIIGGIGIINTMLVAARRRHTEIAVLKSLGMKGRQVVLVFLIESVMLAIAGTIVGVLLGMAASATVNSVTQSLAGYTIPWSLHTRPLVAGVVVGVAATMLFSYLPVLRASRIRPIVALRGDDLTRAGIGKLREFRRHPVRTTTSGVKRLPRGIMRLPWNTGFRTGLLTLLLAAVIGYLAVLYTGLTSGVRTAMVGAIAGIATLVVSGVLIQLFIAIVWLISKLPSMGRLSIRMAFRSMGTQKRRLGSTLLALCIGILCVGSIAILAQNLKSALATGLEKHQNFNVGVQVPHNAASHARLASVVAGLPGIEYRDPGAIANLLALSSVDGTPISTLVQRDLARDKKGNSKFGRDEVTQALQNARGVVGHDVRTSSDAYIMKIGRNLDARDAGTNHVVVSEDFTNVFNIKLGSHLVYAEGTHRVPVTVIGIASQQNFIVFAESIVDVRYMASVGMTAPSPSHFEVAFLKIGHSNLDADISKLRRSLPNSLVLDVNSFLQFTKVIDKLALFPEIIGGLALFAGVIIIANTVALAMLERRREIGIMKAVGARRRTILQFLLVENAIVGFVGAGAGVLIAMLASAILARQLIGIDPSYDWGTILALVLIGMLLAIGASALTALPASSEKPMTVLRYE